MIAFPFDTILYADKLCITYNCVKFLCYDQNLMLNIFFTYDNFCLALLMKVNV